jgi:hypothetical protein
VQEGAAPALELDELCQQRQRVRLWTVSQDDPLGAPAGFLPTSFQIGEEAGAAPRHLGLGQRAGDGELCHGGPSLSI